jgi:hypothetical protein
LNGIQEVVGSIPIGSTSFKGLAAKSAKPFFFVLAGGSSPGTSPKAAFVGLDRIRSNKVLESLAFGAAQNTPGLPVACFGSAIGAISVVAPIPSLHA